MSLVLYQTADDGVNGIVTPEADAAAWDFATLGAAGIINGMAVTHLGGNTLQVGEGRGIVHGRSFKCDNETLLATVSGEGVVNGRLLLRIDLAGDEKIRLVTQAAEQLPALVQEDLSKNGTVYELPLALYQADQIAVSNLVDLRPMAMGAYAFSVIVRADAWQGQSAPYTQRIETDADGRSLAWITPADKCDIPVGDPNHNMGAEWDNAVYLQYLEDFAKIKCVRTVNGGLVFICPEYKTAFGELKIDIKMLNRR